MGGNSDGLIQFLPLTWETCIVLLASDSWLLAPGFCLGLAPTHPWPIADHRGYLEEWTSGWECFFSLHVSLCHSLTYIKTKINNICVIITNTTSCFLIQKVCAKHWALIFLDKFFFLFPVHWCQTTYHYMWKLSVYYLCSIIDKFFCKWWLSYSFFYKKAPGTMSKIWDYFKTFGKLN